MGSPELQRFKLPYYSNFASVCATRQSLVLSVRDTACKSRTTKVSSCSSEKAKTLMGWDE